LSELDSSEDECIEIQEQRERLKQQVTCPARYKVVTKVYKEKSEGLDKSRTINRQFVKLVEVN